MQYKKRFMFRVKTSFIGINFEYFALTVGQVVIQSASQRMLTALPPPQKKQIRGWIRQVVGNNHYCPFTFVCMRSAPQRYLSQAPQNRNINIQNEPYFRSANKQYAQNNNGLLFKK